MKKFKKLLACLLIFAFIIQLTQMNGFGIQTGIYAEEDTESPSQPSNLEETSTGVTSISIEWDASTDNIGVDCYRIYNNNALVGSTTNLTYTIGNLSPGTTYSLAVRAADAANNLSAASTITSATDEDTEAPSSPANFETSSIGTTSIALTWDTSTDNAAIGGYNLYIGNSYIGETSNLFYTISNLNPDTEYEISIKAKDSTGNLSSAATTTATTEQDTQAPTVPANLSCTAVSVISASLSWTSSTDNVAVAGYRIYNNSNLLAETNNLYYMINGLTPDTEYSFVVKAIDATGNLSAASTITVTTNEDTESPTSPTNLILAGKTDTTVALSWSASTDNAGIAYYNIYNGQNYIASTTNTYYTVTGLTEGTQYDFTVKAVDIVGNISTASSMLTVIAALEIPTNVTASPASTAITVSWNAAYGVSEYEIQIGNDIISDISATSYVCRRLTPNTTYVIKVRAKNNSSTGDWSSPIQSTTGAGTTVDGTISQNTVWTADNSPYWISSNLIIESGATLTIEAGTVIKMLRHWEYWNATLCGITVNGTLIVQGTTNEPAVFTSAGDPLYGGGGTLYEWNGFTIGSTGEANFNHTKIRYTSAYTNGAIDATGKLSITNSEITNSITSGINLQTNADATIRNNIITGVSCGISINIPNTVDVDIENNQVACSAYGLMLSQYSAGALTITDNVFTSDNYSAYINPSNFTPTALIGYENNTFSGKQKISSGILKVNMTLPSNTYEVYSLTIASGVTLVIEAGSMIKNCSSASYITNSITVNGTLNAIGTVQNPIVFTSPSDPLYGGSGTIYYWNGIMIGSEGEANLDYTAIRYAGADGSGAICAAGKLIITNSVITNTNSTGIGLISNKNAVISNNVITNTSNGICLIISNTVDVDIENNQIDCSSTGIYIGQYSGGTLTIEGNSFTCSSGCSASINTDKFTPTSLIGFNNNTYIGEQAYNRGILKVNMVWPSNTYTISTDFSIAEGVTLTIDEGSIIKISDPYYDGTGIVINGTLNAEGTSDAPVIFTSGGDPLYGGTSTSIWRGFTINSTGEANLDYTKIRCAGASNGYIWRNYCGAITAMGRLNITHSQISSVGGGILLCTTIQPTIKYNSFVDNNFYAVSNSGSATMTVDASYNYWGSPYGPSRYVLDEDSNTRYYWSTGGGEISDGVSFSPYYGNDLNYQIQLGQSGTYGPSGSFSRQYTDMSMTNSKQTFAMTRTYNSLDSRENTLFGRGWAFDFEGSVSDYTVNLIDSYGNVTTQTVPNLKVVRLGNGSVCSFNDKGNGTYEANDSRNTLTKTNGNYVLTTKDQTTYGFNSSGKLIWIKDKNGNITNININSNGKITSVVDCTGRTYEISYSGNHISRIEDALTGRTVSYSYSNGELTGVVDPAGITTAYTYDSEGFLTGVYDHDNNAIDLITYNHASGNNKDKVTSSTNASGNTSTFSYDVTNKNVMVTDENGYSTIQHYNDNLYIISEQDAEGKITRKGYPLGNKYGEESSITDRNGNTTTYERDAKGNITTITNPDGSTKVMTYDSNNNVLSQKDENGKYVYYIYDTNGNLIKKAQPLNGTDVYSGTDTGFAVTTYAYADQNNIKALLASSTDPEGRVTQYSYDDYGNQSSVTNPENKTTTFSYNSDGWLTQETSPTGDVTHYFYNQNGKQIKKVLDGGETYRIVYDENGRKIKEISPNQYHSAFESNGTYTDDSGTRYTYYSDGTVHTMTDAEDNTTTYTYDMYGNVLTQALPNGVIYRFLYDAMNRVTSKYGRESSSGTENLLESYTYSILSNKNTQKTIKTYTDSTNYLTEVYTYDYAGREIQKQNADGTTLTTAYNANGTISVTTDAAGGITYYSYDGLNRLTDKWVLFSSGLYTYYGFVYDKAGLVTQEKSGVDTVALYAYPNTIITTTSVYNPDATLHSKIDSEGRTTLYYYDDNGMVNKTEQYTNATDKIITEYENNYSGKPVKKTLHVRKGDIAGNSYTDNTDLLLETDYSYDDNGNLLSQEDPNGTITSYTYDNLNRQTGISASVPDEYGTGSTATISSSYTWDGKISQKTDANGNTTRYEYNSNGKLLKETNALNGVKAYYYDLAGRLVAAVSPDNYVSQTSLSDLNRTEYAYDSMSRIQTVTQKYFNTGTNQWISYVEKAYKYDANGNVIKELNASGYAAGTGTSAADKINSGYGTEYTYNYANLLITKLDPVSKDRSLAFSTQYSYDALGRKITETNGVGVITKYSYDAKNNLLSVKIQKSTSDPEQTIKVNTYDFLGNLLSETDGNGNTITSTYNALGKVKTIVYPGDSSIASKTQYHQYDAKSNLVKTWDSADGMLLYTYDSLGRKLSETSSKTDATQAIALTFRYDKNGNLRFSTDGNNVQTQNTYDALNRLVTQTKNGQTQTNTYDAQGNLLTTTDWRNNTTTCSYDSLNRLIEKKDSYQKVIEALGYNNDNRQTTSTDALDNVTTFEYDKNGRLVNTIDPANHGTAKTYDNAGNVHSTTDADNNTSISTYDEFNRLVSVTNAKQETTSYTYDLNGNMLTLTDGNGKTKTSEYNAANKIIRSIDDGGRTGTAPNYSYLSSKVESYTYYSNGLLHTKTDRNGATTTYTYDIHGRTTREEIPNETDITHTYDNNGNVLVMTDGTGTTTRTYDGQNRVSTKAISGIGTTSFVYDITANLTAGYVAETSTDPMSNVVEKVYDKAGRLKYVIADAQTTTYNYNDNGSRASVVYQDGSREEYTYYTTGLLHTLINYDKDNAVIDSYHYEYDNARNLLVKTDAKGDTTYTYDALNRLLTVEDPNAKITTYSYDEGGNRLTEITVDGTTSTTITYTYNEQNRLTGTGTVVNTVTTEAAAYAYDNNGNQLSVTKTPYVNGVPQTAIITMSNTYDKRNQLTQTITNDGSITGTIQNTYNGEGYRVSKTVDNATTKYLYEYDKVVLEVDSANNQKAWNVYGENLLSRKVTIVNGFEKLYYLYNGHSDVTALLNANDGTVEGTYYYDAFGNILEHTGTDSNVTYSEYQYDQETGLYYLNARMYDPTTARFLQEDTYGGESNDPLSLNRYAYCHNEPLMYSDPTGHMSLAEYYGLIDYYAKDAGMTNVHLEQDLYDNVNRLNKAIDTVQNVISYMGFVPGLGSIPDAVNAGIYALRGKKTEAAIALVSIVAVGGAGFVIGKIASKAVKALDITADLVKETKISIKASEEAFDAVKAINRVEHIAEASENVIGKIVKTASEADDIAKSTLTREATNLAGEGIETGIRKLASEEAQGAARLLEEGVSNSKYQVGIYQEIKGAAGLDAHHVGQKSLMKDLVENYDYKIAPAINVPKVGHTISGPNGIVSRNVNGVENARQLLARDITELRKIYNDIPNSALKELINLNKKMYPEMRIK